MDDTNKIETGKTKCEAIIRARWPDAAIKWHPIETATNPFSGDFALTLIATSGSEMHLPYLSSEALARLADGDAEEISRINAAVDAIAASHWS